MGMMLPEGGPPAGPGPPGPGPGGPGLPPELIDAIQGAGAGGAAPDPTAGLPPELLAMAGAGPPGPDAGGPPVAGSPSGPGTAAGRPGIDDPLFATLVSMLAKMAAQEPDHADSAALLDLVAKLKKLIGGRQNEDMAAIGGSPGQMRAMSRAYGG